MWSELASENFLTRSGGAGPQVHDHIVLRLAGNWSQPQIQRFDVAHDTLMSMVAQVMASRWPVKLRRKCLFPASYSGPFSTSLNQSPSAPSGRRTIAARSCFIFSRLRNGNPRADQPDVDDDNRRAFAKTRSVAINRSSIGAISLIGSIGPVAPVILASCSAYATKSR